LPISTDLVAFASLNMPADEVATSGGGIDLDRRVDFTQIAANDTIEALSDNAGDTTQNLTIEARAPNGSVVSETKALTGTTPIAFSTLGTVERVLLANLSADAAGIVTVRRATGPVTIRVIPAGERGFLMMFRKSAADESGGSQRKFYEKFFWKNLHGTQALLSAAVAEEADPETTVDHLLATAVNDTGTATNRQTVPTGLADGNFNSTSKTVPGTDLGAGAAIGVWLRLTRAAGAAAIRTTYQSKLSGQSV